MYQRYNRRCKRKYFLQGASSSRKKFVGVAVVMVMVVVVVVVVRCRLTAALYIDILYVGSNNY